MLRCPSFRKISKTARFLTSATAVNHSDFERASTKVLQFRKNELSLTNPDDLYLMTDYLKQEFHDKTNFSYPIKTTCDGELIETEFYCPFEPNLSPHYAKLYNTRDQRSKLYAIPPNETDMKKYNRINCEKFASLMAPNSNYEDTEMVVFFYSMSYFLNDQTAHVKLPEESIQPHRIDELNDHLLQYLDLFLDIFEPETQADLERIWNFLEFYQPYFTKTRSKIALKDEYKGRAPPQIGLVKKMTGYITERFSTTKNITQVIYEMIRYVKAIKNEIKIRERESFTLSLEEYDQFRDNVTSTPVAHSITDLTKQHFSYEAYRNPLFIKLENLTSEIITYYNDVCTCDRERLDGDPFNSVFILRHLHNLSYPDSCQLVAKLSNDKLKKFMNIKNNLLEQISNESEKQAVAQMIKNREDSLIGYLLHEMSCVTRDYSRDYKPMMKEFFERNVLAKT